LYFYLRYILGYTYVDQRTGTSSFDFDGCQEDEGTDGVFTASDFTFSAASASFVAGHQDWFIVSLDSANDSNCGIHKIASVDSSTQVTVNFNSTDFPTANTGISWWLVDSDVASALTDNSSTTTNEGVVLRGNHATVPFEIFLHLFHASSNDRLGIEFAPASGAWDTVGHAWKTTLNNPVFLRRMTIYLGRGDDPSGPRMYAVGNTDFSWLSLMHHRRSGSYNKYYASWGILDPIFESSPARTAEEKFAVFGTTTTAAVDGTRNGNSTSGIDYGEVWSAKRPASYPARWCGWYDSAQDYFKRGLTEVNHREGTEYDGLPIWVQGDADADEDSQWALWGSIPKAEMALAACAGIGELTTFGSKQYMHWVEGIVTPWPGLAHV
jgi:hypothetical protein